MELEGGCVIDVPCTVLKSWIKPTLTGIYFLRRYRVMINIRKKEMKIKIPTREEAVVLGTALGDTPDGEESFCMSDVGKIRWGDTKVSRSMSARSAQVRPYATQVTNSASITWRNSI